MERSGMNTTDTIKTKHSIRVTVLCDIFSANSFGLPSQIFSRITSFRRTLTRPVGLASAAYMQRAGGLAQAGACVQAVKVQISFYLPTIGVVTPPIALNHSVVGWPSFLNSRNLFSFEIILTKTVSFF